MDNGRYDHLHEKWKYQGLTDIENDEFGKIIVKRAVHKKEEIEREFIGIIKRAYDLHHILPQEARKIGTEKELEKRIAERTK